MARYGMRLSNPIGGDDKAFGGAGMNLGIEALAGDTDLITVFDDFNGIVATDEFGAATNWETLGWVLTDVGVPVADQVGMQDAADVDQWYPSCIRIFTGTADDAGGNMQLDRVNASLPASNGATFPHLWIPETAAGAGVLDNHTLVFACRVGFAADETGTGTDWDSKAFIGFAEAGDTGILSATTGAITIAAGGPLVGFWVPEDGSIAGASFRDPTQAITVGTNTTVLKAAGSVDSSAANPITWFDLAVKLTITDMSDNSANGQTEFYSRQVQPNDPVLNRGGTHDSSPRWIKHPTVLLNQTPNNDVALVPTIEVVNGPTAGRDGAVYLDWWAFGCSRFSLR